jgi:hypothetical protein
MTTVKHSEYFAWKNQIIAEIGKKAKENYNLSDREYKVYVSGLIAGITELSAALQLNGIITMNCDC